MPEPSSLQLAGPPGPIGQPPARRQPRPFPIVAGSLAGLLALLLLVLGGGLLTFAETQRDPHGFLMRGANRLLTTTYAVVSDQVKPNRGGFDWGMPYGNPVQIKTTSATRVFVGIASAAAVDRYLAAAPHLQVPDLGTGDGATTTRGWRPPSPATQRFWVAMSSGVGTRTLRWHARGGAWRAVVMNADGSRDVSANVIVGIRMPHMTATAVGVLAAATLAAALLHAGLHAPERPSPSRDWSIR
jgi:hypothetical protein